VGGVPQSGALADRGREGIPQCVRSFAQWP
jgi:hypothetical protein